MWRYKLPQFKECHLVVIALNFAQSLGAYGKLGTWVIRPHKCGDMQHFLFWIKTAGSCYLISRELFGLSKCFWWLFVRRVHRCCVTCFVQIGEITWEEFEKVGFWYFANLRKIKNRRRKWAWPRLSTIHWMCGCKVFEYETKYMGIMSQNLTLITVSPSGGNSEQQ